jgi:hypothetical protein
VRRIGFVAVDDSTVSPTLVSAGQEAQAVPHHCTTRHQGGPERCAVVDTDFP